MLERSFNMEPGDTGPEFKLQEYKSTDLARSWNVSESTSPQVVRVYMYETAF